MTQPNTGAPTNESNPAPVTPAQPPPSVVAPPSASPQPAGISAADGAALLGAISALPEKIVNSIREATPPPPPAPVEPKKETPVEKPAESTPAQSKSFTDWWFGR